MTLPVAAPIVALTPLDALHPAPWNPRTLKDYRFNQLCESLKADPDLMQRRPILAQADGTIYAGNMRWRAAKYLGWATVPAIVEDVPEQLARERALRDNNVFGEWQDDQLAEILYALGQQDTDLASLGFEPAEPMLGAARARFAGYSGLVEIRRLDLRRDYPLEMSSVTLAVLTLMFVPINYRLRLIQLAHDHLVPGGAFVIVEKVLGATAGLDAVMVERYHRMKHEAGYTWEEIDRKRLALEGVQVPVTARWNEEALVGAGFRQIECFWRWMNFAAWVAVRD